MWRRPYQPREHSEKSCPKSMVLNILLIIAQHCIVLQFSTMSNATWVEKYLEDRTHGLCMQQVWIQEQLKVLVKQHLEVVKIWRWCPGAFRLDQTWLFWFERQKFWRNWWASRISSFILTSSFWSKGICSRSNTTWINFAVILPKRPDYCLPCELPCFLTVSVHASEASMFHPNQPIWSHGVTFLKCLYFEYLNPCFFR